MDLTLMNKAQRIDYRYVRECMHGLYDISVHSVKARRNRRMLTKILDRWLEEGHIEDYRLSKGKRVEDAFGVHGQDVTLMIEIFTGKDIKDWAEPQWWHNIDPLPELPPPDNRPLDHSFQGKRHPFHYTLVQRQMEDKRKLKQWQCDNAGVPFTVGTPLPKPKRQPSKYIKELLKKERLF